MFNNTAIRIYLKKCNYRKQMKIVTKMQQKQHSGISRHLKKAGEEIKKNIVSEIRPTLWRNVSAAPAEKSVAVKLNRQRPLFITNIIRAD